MVASPRGCAAPDMPDFYSIQVETLTGETTTLAPYEGKTLLIVNTASKCGYTPQYAGLNQLYRKYGDRGLVVMGFPCNQFMQEPGDERAIAAFCSLEYAVEFPMFAKIDVNGPRTHPLYRHLKPAAPGLLGSEAVKWNFTKFLVSSTGIVVGRFGPRETPEDIEPTIARWLPRQLTST
jgi:glutathione peroxidase